MKSPQHRDFLQSVAEDVQQATKARYVIVLAMVDHDPDDGGGTIVMGAWVPDMQTASSLLTQAAASLDQGTALVIDKRTGMS